ncbi:excinuclease ABC subunit UvrC [Litorivicinus lipolyticus]|uniref:excinuclease ABC subunit UvrC n=1 Tax=Litorivicinus lipolyticus TaxID=418701 RepID=UPI003B5CB90B
MTDFDPKRILKSLPMKPGVYQMLDADGGILYVGKAKKLKNRVSSYFRGSGLNTKTMALVSHIRDIQVTVTANETEALLLEHNLIKAHRPPYNISLRDDKSYPFIWVDTRQAFPAVRFRRGRVKGKGMWFGPFPSGGGTRDTIDLIQKTFQLRSCEDSVFSNRSRPCLQYQIKRCSGSCVGLISEDQYAEDLAGAALYLNGRSQVLIDNLTDKMDGAAAALEFEQAARYRDQMGRLRRMQSQQGVDTDYGDVDVIAIESRPGISCISLLVVRDGRLLGHREFWPGGGLDEEPEALLEAFVPQYYLGEGQHSVPSEVLLSHPVGDEGWLSSVLAAAVGQSVKVGHRFRATRARWMQMARDNASQALSGHLGNRLDMNRRRESLAEILGLDTLPVRMECFDISHTQGEATVASCVVFDDQGPLKSDYRVFNIRDAKAGDDYAAMHEALERRYNRVKGGEIPIPDVLVIDGGPGQVTQARDVLSELGLHQVKLLGIAKGPTRKAGMEWLHIEGNDLPIRPPSDAPGLHLLQHIRDEAHRFAITKHRQARGKARITSPLEGIAGVGPKRRQQLLRHFGGLREIQGAGLHELASAPGMSQKLASVVYAALHGES